MNAGDSPRRPVAPDAAYTGTGNLEVMAEAVNYNRYLLGLVRRAARPGDRIADIGAGIGTFAAALAADGYDVACVEPDAAQAEVLRSRGLAHVHDASELPAGSLDFVYSFNVLEHIEDDAAAASTWVSRLRPGGRMLVYVPAFDLLFSSMDRKVGHVRRYRRASLRRVLEGAGLEVGRVRYADSAGFFATLAFKALGNDSGEIDRRALVAYDRVAFPVSRAADRLLDRVVGKNVVATGRRRA